MVEASQAGSYTLPSSDVEVDPENSVSESHENNNRPVSEVITEVGAAILQPSLLSHSLSAGESGSLSLTLVNRGLVEEAGVEGESGAVLYQTTSFFLEKLGLNSISDLPALAPFLPNIDGLDEVLSTLTD